MHLKTLIYFLFIASSIYSQEIGMVKNGVHSLKLEKVKNTFYCVYTDINSKVIKEEKRFNFPKKETVYAIIMDGFEYQNDHQVIVLTDKNTVVKFQFNSVDGVVLMKINQTSLINKRIGNSAFFNKEQIKKLFGESVL